MKTMLEDPDLTRIDEATRQWLIGQGVRNGTHLLQTPEICSTATVSETVRQVLDWALVELRSAQAHAIANGSDISAALVSHQWQRPSTQMKLDYSCDIASPAELISSDLTSRQLARMPNITTGTLKDILQFSLSVLHRLHLE